MSRAARIVRRGQLKAKAAMSEAAFKTGVEIGMTQMRNRIVTAAFHLTYEA